MTSFCRDRYILELDTLDWTSRFSPDNGKHLAVLDIGETVCRRYVLEGDISDSPALVRTGGNASDFREFYARGEQPHARRKATVRSAKDAFLVTVFRRIVLFKDLLFLSVIFSYRCSTSNLA